MSDLKKAAQQALEALMWHDEGMRTRADSEAIAALRSALAQQEEGRMEFNVKETVCHTCGSTNGAHSHDCPVAKAALEQQEQEWTGIPGTNVRVRLPPLMWGGRLIPQTDTPTVPRGVFYTPPECKQKEPDLCWTEAPNRTQWGTGMMEGLVELGKDHTLRLYTEREALPLVVPTLKAALEQPEPRNQCGETCERAKLCAVCARGLAQEEQEQEPVAWIQPDHLQKARRAPFLCRVEPTQRCADFVPIYTAPPRPTGLPHCERSCEANAFQIEIRRLQAALKERDA